jgi:hypothetical protein
MLVQHVPSSKKATAVKVRSQYSGPQADEVVEHMLACKPRGPLVLHVAKLFPRTDGTKFDAFGRIMSGTLRPGEAPACLPLLPAFAACLCCLPACLPAFAACLPAFAACLPAFAACLCCLPACLLLCCAVLCMSAPEHAMPAAPGHVSQHTRLPEPASAGVQVSCLAALLPCCLAALLPCCLAALLPCCLAAC